MYILVEILDKSGRTTQFIHNDSNVTNGRSDCYTNFHSYAFGAVALLVAQLYRHFMRKHELWSYEASLWKLSSLVRQALTVPLALEV